MISNDRGYRNDAATERLTKQHDISGDVFMLAGERTARAAEPRLDFVRNKQHSILAGQLAYSSEIAGWRNPYPRLPLNRLEQYCHNVIGDRIPKRLKITVRNHYEARSVRPEMIVRQRVVGEADDRRGTAMEIAGGNDDQSATVGHAFDLVSPLTSDLDRRLHSLGAGVHWQHHVLADQGCQAVGKRRQLIMVKGARGQRQSIKLLSYGGNQHRMPVAEVVG